MSAAVCAMRPAAPLSDDRTVQAMMEVTEFMHHPVESPTHLLKQFMLSKKWSYLVSILSIVASEIVMVQFPNILGRFTDTLKAGRLTGGQLLHYVWWLLAVGTGYVVLYGIGQLRNGQLGREFEYRLRRRLFRHWESLSTAYFRQRSIGDLLNHAMNDVRAVRDALTGGMNLLTNAVFLLITTLFMTFRTVSIKLTLVSMIPLLALPIFIIWWGPRIRNALREAQEALSEMAAVTEESLSAIRLIKATANEDVEANRFADKVDLIVRRQMAVFRQSGLFQTLIPFTGSVSFAIALSYGGYLTIDGQIPLGAFVAFTLYLAMLITPLQQMGFVFNYFQRASASLKRLEVLLGEEPDIKDPEHPVDVDQITGDIEVDLPEFRYPDGVQPALLDIHFRVRSGQTIGIVGRTGAGKTTLVNLLPRIFDPPKGTVRVDGYDVHSLRLKTLRESIAYVPQDGFLFSTTIGENIGFSREDASREELLEAADNACFRNEIESFPDGLDTLIGERGVALSGGQKQRAAIARAFLKDAPILILDDSLSAVDMNTEKQILENVRRIRRGKTTLIVAHRLSAVRHADVLLVLDKGRIVERGTHDELVQQGGLYASLYALQEAATEEVRA
ncbi:ABC transporter ATP-binding protein [Alicyclobacillus pomorum]|uniref:ABC transporter ATP-binding protein n=1 Tax=Alicyclobacillus pomorum TaxID=204470 RepID=UPI001FE1B45B|nr:ABC transporter ATP-binding protein [Alicyclobacillus pomorum]